MRVAAGFDQRYFFMQSMSGTHAGERPVSHRLPPLSALRAFEAAARHLSFTRAAQELHVTQTAISHQIRALEDLLGVKLFRRLPRGLVLTEEAQKPRRPRSELANQTSAAASSSVTWARAAAV